VGAVHPERALPADRADAATAAGRRLTTAQTVAYAWSDVWVGPGGSGSAASPLSARGYEVAGLVAQGLTNGQIGARLGLSARTVETHLRSIRSKLDLRSRTQIASWMVRHATDQA
jgi:DNA-binding CsgD family transcriptional regulator